MEDSKQTLFSLAERGVIAGPGESKEKFFYRVARLPKEERLENYRYGFALDWVPLRLSNEKLPFWQGGATWVEERRAEIQLRKKILFGYSRDEVLQHELVHALRAPFEEPVYEEIFAYRTSPVRWRRYVGPLFRSYKAMILLGGMLLFYPLGALAVLALQGVRLGLDLRKLEKALGAIAPLVDNAERFVLFLTDREIRLFSRMSAVEIAAFAREQGCLRWTQLRLLMKGLDE